MRAASSNCSIHANVPEIAQSLLGDIKKTLSPKEIYLAELSPVIGTHVDPGDPCHSLYAWDVIKKHFSKNTDQITTVTSLLEMCCIFHN